MTKSIVMTKAWEIARKGANKFGGKVSEYFQKALKMAWALVKKVSTLDEEYNELKFHVRAIKLEMYGKVDEMFLEATDLIEFIGTTKEGFKNEMKYVDPGMPSSWKCEVNGIICEVLVLKKYIHEM